MTDGERIEAIRSVRIEAHGLINACAALIGGVPFAITLTFEDIVGQPTRGICPKALEDKAPGQP